MIVLVAPNHDTTACSVQATFQASQLDQVATFAVTFSKPDFYAQQVRYNVSYTTRSSMLVIVYRYQLLTMVFKQTLREIRTFLVLFNQLRVCLRICLHFVYFSTGDILRGNATVEVMSILTYIGDCKSGSPGPYFAVRKNARVSSMHLPFISAGLSALKRGNMHAKQNKFQKFVLSINDNGRSGRDVVQQF